MTTRARNRHTQMTDQLDFVTDSRQHHRQAGRLPEQQAELSQTEGEYVTGD